MIISRDEAFRVVCKFVTPHPKKPDTDIIGTGMFVCSLETGTARGQQCWIVTANHVAKDTTERTNIIIATKEGKALTVPLITFGNLDNWYSHPFADVSAFKISPTSVNTGLIIDRCFPLDHVFFRHVPVSRDIELTCVGFPNGYGTDLFFSPFTFRSYASSGLVTLPRADTHMLQEAFCLENPSVGGYSGGPVFDLGYSYDGVVRINREKTWCYGIMHGTMSDQTGGKIALVTPAFYLKDILK